MGFYRQPKHVIKRAKKSKKTIPFLYTLLVMVQGLLRVLPKRKTLSNISSEELKGIHILTELALISLKAITKGSPLEGLVRKNPLVHQAITSSCLLMCPDCSRLQIMALHFSSSSQGILWQLSAGWVLHLPSHVCREAPLPHTGFAVWWRSRPRSSPP